MMDPPDQDIDLDETGGDDKNFTDGGDDETPTETNISDQEKQILRDKMKDMFAKIILDIDQQVLTVSESQCELDSQLDRLLSTLDSIKIDEKLTDEISSNAKRISSLKSRLTLIHTILSNSSARCCRTLAACGVAVNSLNNNNRNTLSDDYPQQPASQMATATSATHDKPNE